MDDLQIVQVVDSVNIYLMTDGSYRWYDESGLVSEPHSSVAMARVDILDYETILDHGRCLVLE